MPQATTASRRSRLMTTSCSARPGSTGDRPCRGGRAVGRADAGYDGVLTGAAVRSSWPRRLPRLTLFPAGGWSLAQVSDCGRQAGRILQAERHPAVLAYNTEVHQRMRRGSTSAVCHRVATCPNERHRPIWHSLASRGSGFKRPQLRRLLAGQGLAPFLRHRSPLTAIRFLRAGLGVDLAAEGVSNAPGAQTEERGERTDRCAVRQLGVPLLFIWSSPGR